MATKQQLFSTLLRTRIIHTFFGDAASDVAREVCTRPAILSANPRASRDFCAAPRERTECRGIKKKCAQIPFIFECILD